MDPKVLQLRDKVDNLESDMNSIFEELLRNIEDSASRPISTYPIYDKKSLVADMRQRKKRVSLEELELQTDISSSTIKRMLKDPSKTSLDNFLAIANELGMKIWIEK